MNDRNLIICKQCRKQHFKGERVCSLCKSDLGSKEVDDLFAGKPYSTGLGYSNFIGIISNILRFIFK